MTTIPFSQATCTTAAGSRLDVVALTAVKRERPSGAAGSTVRRTRYARPLSSGVPSGSSAALACGTLHVTPVTSPGSAERIRTTNSSTIGSPGFSTRTLPGARSICTTGTTLATIVMPRLGLLGSFVVTLMVLRTLPCMPDVFMSASTFPSAPGATELSNRATVQLQVGLASTESGDLPAFLSANVKCTDSPRSTSPASISVGAISCDSTDSVGAGVAVAPGSSDLVAG